MGGAWVLRAGWYDLEKRAWVSRGRFDFQGVVIRCSRGSWDSQGGGFLEKVFALILKGDCWSFGGFIGVSVGVIGLTGGLSGGVPGVVEGS